jgi:hypothetical protein
LFDNWELPSVRDRPIHDSALHAVTKKDLSGREKSYSNLSSSKALNALAELAPHRRRLFLAYGRLLGFIGPVPPPLWIRASTIFNCQQIIAYANAV